MTHCTLPIHYRIEVSKCVGPYFSHQNLSSSGAIHYAEMVEAGPCLLGACDAVLKERVGRGVRPRRPKQVIDLTSEISRAQFGPFRGGGDRGKRAEPWILQPWFSSKDREASPSSIPLRFPLNKPWRSRD